MNTRYCLVLGSKPGAPLPDIRPEHIITANGAAELAHRYKDHKSGFTAVVSSLQYKNSTVHSKIIASRPDQIVIRGHKQPRQMEPVNHISVTYMDGQRQFRLDRSYFGIFALRAFLLRPGLSKAKSIVRHLQGRDYIFGSSTGLWSVLYALDRFPDLRVVVTGVGLQGGGHFYGKDEFRSEDGIKDYLVARHLNREMRSRLLTTDENFSKRTGAALWDGEILSQTYT